MSKIVHITTFATVMRLHKRMERASRLADRTGDESAFDIASEVNRHFAAAMAGRRQSVTHARGPCALIHVRGLRDRTWA
jgi:hypothetical protein